MRKITIATAMALAAVVGACKKTSNGDVEVQRPTIGTTTDTIHTPTVEVGKDTHTVVTPKVEVRKDTSKVVTPKVKVKP